MAIPQSKKISMNLVLLIILKLLSRPVVCANFQGLEANTFFQLEESFKETVWNLEATRVRSTLPEYAYGRVSTVESCWG
jgi:hypothetical protein